MKHSWKLGSPQQGSHNLKGMKFQYFSSASKVQN